MNTISFTQLPGRPSCKVYHKPGQEKLTLKNVFDEAQNILIVGHQNPDGDAVGSTQALYRYLKISGKNASVIYPNGCARNLLWMDTDRKVRNFANHPEEVKRMVEACDLLCVLDFNRLGRTEALAPVLRAKQVRRILIDHHLEPTWSDFDLGFSDTTVSSTCELLYHVFQAELDPSRIDVHTAECLYAGISTDTGSFSYSCAHQELFSAIADLISKGLDTVKVHQRIFDNFSESRTRLLGCCLGERLMVKPEYHTAYMYLSDAELRKYNYQSGDTEGIVNYGLSIAGIRFAAFFTQRDSRVRMSFRSQGGVDVNIFAKEHFNGGGHKNAAGAMSTEPLEAVLAKFEAVLPQFYKEHIEPHLLPEDFE